MDETTERLIKATAERAKGPAMVGYSPHGSTAWFGACTPSWSDESIEVQGSSAEGAAAAIHSEVLDRLRRLAGQEQANANRLQRLLHGITDG